MKVLEIKWWDTKEKMTNIKIFPSINISVIVLLGSEYKTLHMEHKTLFQPFPIYFKSTKCL